MAWAIPYYAPGGYVSQWQTGYVRNLTFVRRKAVLSVLSQPTAGHTVILTDVNGTVLTCEFTSGGPVGPGNVAVTIGGTTAITADNLAAAFAAWCGTTGGSGTYRIGTKIAVTRYTSVSVSATISLATVPSGRLNYEIPADRAARIGPRLAVTAVGTGRGWYDPSPAPPR